MNNEAYLVPNPTTPCQPVRIDPELCISCYRCADQCRMDVMVRNIPKPEGRSRCEVGCPAGENIRWTTYFIEKGLFTRALENIRAENPFPGICGRVCFHPCEEKCARIDFDAGIATNALERAAFDYADHQQMDRPPKRPATRKKVAVIGGGPAGLTCAYYLAVLGHEVTVFEAQPIAGGIPRLNIPDFRLPAAVVELEVKEVAMAGVDIRVNNKVDSKTFSKLVREYDACFIATGAPVSQKLNVPGEEHSRVISALEFLRRTRLGEKISTGNKVVVIGGGNVATDSARLARRLGAKKVEIICLESRDIMPAYKAEIEAAEAEGVVITPSWGVKEIQTNGKQIKNIILKSCISVYDKDGRFNPVYDEKTTRSIDADIIIPAIGQTTDLSFADTKIIAGNRIKTDPDTLATDIPGVFAGGDVGSAIRSIVQAIASGKRAAISIDLYLAGGNRQVLAATGRGATSLEAYFQTGSAQPVNKVPVEIQSVYYGPGARQGAEILPADRRTSSNEEVNRGFSQASAILEARRCFRCSQYGPPIVLYPDECWFCGTCVEECPVKGAIRMEHPLNQKVGWKRKETGELFRIGMRNPPPPNTRPPVG